LKVLIILFLVFISGCTQTNTKRKVKEVKSPKVLHKMDDVIKTEVIEETITYQDIVAKINDVNIKNKNNDRVKTIVKEYYYNTSDDDSKNSARKKALHQVKILILEEIGVFVESYLNISDVVTNKKYQMYFKKEIKNITAGIIKTKILSEKYNGKIYYIKVSSQVDPDSVSEGIAELLKIKANKGEIKKLNKLLLTKDKEIDMRSNKTVRLQKEIAVQTLLSKAKESELKETKIELGRAQKLLKSHQREQLKINTRLDEIKNIINTKTKNALQNIERGMTLAEVKQVAGNPRMITKYTYGKLLNYGKVVAHIENGVTACITKASCDVKQKCGNYNWAYETGVYKSQAESCVLK